MLIRIDYSQDPAKRLAQEAIDLSKRLYNASIEAAVAGDRHTFCRLERLQALAHKRYERRYNKIRR